MYRRLAATLCFVLAPPAALSAAEGDLVIRGADVLPMTGEAVLEDVTVTIRGGVIAAIGRDDGTPAAGAAVVDAEGGFLLPGLIEPHVHLRDRMSLDLFLGHGVTTIRNMDGTPQVLEWREAVAEGELLGPTIVSGSPFLHRNAKDAPDRWVASVEDAVRQTRRYAGQGYDYIKIAELDDEPFFALMAEARRLGIPVVGHIPNYELDLEAILGERMRSIEHVEELFRVVFEYEADETKIPAFVEQVRRSGVPISTLIFSERVKNELFAEREAFLTPERRRWIERYHGPAGIERLRETLEMIENGDWPRHWVDVDFLLRLVKALHDAGVVVVPGTDSGGSMVIAGFGLLEELELFRRAGLTPHETLRSATLDAARVLGLEDRKGSVEVGKDADLVLYAGDPRQDPELLAEPIGVAVRGVWLDAGTTAELRGRTFDAVED